MSEPLAYFNGQFLAQAEVRLPLNDAGFVFGATVTDLCRTFHHRLFRLEDHVARFRQSCHLARVPQPLPDPDLIATAEKLAAHNAGLLTEDRELALVMIATPGPIGYYAGEPGGPGDGVPTLIMHTFPLPFARYRRLFSEGATLFIPPVKHVSAASVDPRIKQRSRLHWWLADRAVHEVAPGASALLVNADGHITETAAANFLLVQKGVVISPPRSAILGGISLLTTEELCRAQSIPFVEKALSPSDCETAEEAMLASTSYCLAGVRRVGSIELAWPGPIFERLLAAWNQRVGLDIRAQILRNG